MAKGTGSEVIEVKINRPEMTFQGYLMNNMEAEDEEHKTYIFFMGVPYAKPPLGELRFQPPQEYVYDPDKDGNPYKAMTGTKTAAQVTEIIVGLTKEEKKKLLKKKNIAKHSRFGVPTTEDCLYLNIYIPKRPEEISKPLAVMVYFHGGGFFQGSGNYSERTPESMMLHDILLVMVNYRLGPFGFLNMHSEKCKGNAGLKDQVKALEWVRDNIRPFGGDPDNVTICGESAGGSCVNFHLLSPLSKGLFHKAIVQSGGIYCPWGYTGDQRRIIACYEKYKDLLKGKETILVEKLLKANAEAILCFDMKMDLMSKMYGSIDVHLGPSIESFMSGAFIPYGVSELMKDAEPIPVLAGITALDGYSIFIEEEPLHFIRRWILTDDYFCDFLGSNLHWKRETVEKHYREIREKYFNLEETKKACKMLEENDKSEPKRSFLCLPKFKRTVPPSRSPSRSPSRPTGSFFPADLEYAKAQENPLLEFEEGVAKFCTDLWFYRFYDNFKLGDGLKKPAPLYIYEFDLVSELNMSKEYRKKMTSAAHCDDLVYLFCPAHDRQLEFPFSEDIKEKVNTMCSLWASFCKTGTPECASLNVPWEPHTEDEPRYLYIGEELVMKNGRLNEDRWKYLNAKVQAEEQTKLKTSHPRTWNTPAAFQTNVEQLRQILDEMTYAEIPSISPLDSAASSPGAFVPSEDSKRIKGSESLQPSTSLSTTSEILKLQKAEEGTTLATLEVPSTDSSKRHSPSRSPTSESKTAKDESSKAKKERPS